MKHIFTISLCFLALSLSAQVDCPNTFDNNSDGAVTINDLLDLLAVFGDTDTDSDGIWDSIDDCIDLTACNYANDPTEACNYIDVLGNCGGGCEGDSDNDGICDSEDDCVGVLDECGVCNGPGATEMIIESITILYDSLYAEQIDEWWVFEIGADTVFNYVCDPVFADCGDLVSHEGYDYSTVQIGDQCWFSENCRYLPGSITSWGEGSLNDPIYYVIDYDEYGVLYNWPAVMTEGICPSGWHIPSDGEFTQLTDYLGGWGVAGGNMKDDVLWNGTNSSGWTGLPGGYRSSDTNIGFGLYGSNGYWWSASESGSDSWSRMMSSSSDIVARFTLSKSYGFSARCVIDYTDECGVLNGDNSTCLDECGVPNGDNSTCLDECGVPNGDNSTCFISCGDPISHEGYDYSTVLIGEQCWFSENCRYLPSVSPTTVASSTSPFYYVYGYDGYDVGAAVTTSNYDTYGVLYNSYETYGVLYNWPAVMTAGICPSGWHIPSDGEFTELTDFLGSGAGYHMKSTSGWNSGGNGSNSSGFTGLPGGSRVSGGSWNAGGFYDSGFSGKWWSASEYSEYNSYSMMRWLRHSYDIVDSGSIYKHFGFSARCVRD
jgi:uncharacterized protein (TIGR02145 family)